MMTTMTLSILASIMFAMTKHPLSMGLMLIIQTILVALTTGLMINNFWFSYILIISMLSGALVLFIYMASVASNEKFHSSMSMGSTILITLILSALLPFLVDQLSMSSIWSTSKKDMLGMDQVLTLLKLFNLHNLTITIMLVLYLFLTMIVISYITSIHEGPLRMKN